MWTSLLGNSATSQLIWVLRERLGLYVRKYKTPYDMATPAIPTHSMSTLLNTICRAAGRNSRIGEPRKASLYFRHLLGVFLLGMPSYPQQSKETGDKRSHCSGKYTPSPQMWQC